MSNDYNRTNKHRRQINKKNIRRYAGGGFTGWGMSRDDTDPSIIKYYRAFGAEGGEGWTDEFCGTAEDCIPHCEGVCNTFEDWGEDMYNTPDMGSGLGYGDAMQQVDSVHTPEGEEYQDLFRLHYCDGEYDGWSCKS